MDRLSKEVSFTFSNVEIDAARLNDVVDVYLRVVGDFTVIVGDRVLYAEKLFCLVEFAVKSQLWVRSVTQEQRDFIYSSLESDEVGLFWIKNVEGLWRIGSIHQEYEELSAYAYEPLANALDAYFDRLQVFVAKTFGKDINEVLDWAAVRRTR